MTLPAQAIVLIVSAQEAMEKYNIEKASFSVEGHEFESLKNLQEIAHHIKREVCHHHCCGQEWAM